MAQGVKLLAGTSLENPRAHKKNSQIQWGYICNPRTSTVRREENLQRALRADELQYTVPTSARRKVSIDTHTSSPDHTCGLWCTHR